MSTELRRELGTFSCTMLVAGNMIGIGIFITAGRIYNVLPNPSHIFLAWLIGGFLSIAGGLTYAELATRFPRAGGGYVYLREAFGPFFGFLAGFSTSMVTIPGTGAFLSMGFAKYAGISDPITSKLVGILLILFISYINYRGVIRGAKLQNGFMILKFLLIFVLVFAGFLSRKGSFGNFAVSGTMVHSILFALPLALVPIMYTYSGWDAAVYVAGEMKNPRRTIPLSLFSGTFLVVLTYLTLAALYIYAIPVTSPQNHTKIVTAASKVFFGETIGNIIGGLVAISILGCLSAHILTGPRVVYAMAKDNLLPSFAKDVHSVFATPAKAIWFQGIWTCVLIISGTFDRLLDYVTVPSVFFGAITGIGFFVLRFKNRADKDTVPYLTFGYPILPALFVLGMGWIVVSTALKSPKDSLWGLFIVALGIPIYYIRQKFSKSST